MRIALVGSGVAAIGVLDAIAEWAPHAEVTVFDHGAQVKGRFEPTANDPEWTPAMYAEFYASLRREHGWKFPPPKTHFGTALPRRPVEGWGSIWESRALGGLTNFWGGSAIQFTQRDLQHWSLSAQALLPYYRRASTRIGVSGRTDALSRYFEDECLTRPPIDLPPVMAKLESILQRAPRQQDMHFYAGVGRLALETRPGNASACDFNGNCMIGCRADAIYNARRDLERFKAAGLVKQVVEAHVVSVDRTRTLHLRDGAMAEAGPFDRVYICAGCAGTTEVAMHSLDIQAGPAMVDNSVLSFPILYTGSQAEAPSSDRMFGLTNLIMIAAPAAPARPPAMVQIYPTFNHLWRYYVPVGLWKAFGPVARLMRGRLMLGRLYLHGDHSQTYAAHLTDRGIAWQLQRRPAKLSALGNLWPSIRKTLSRDGFTVPPIPPIQHKTSSHYAATLPLGSATTARSGEIFPGVLICDSATFTDAPAASPTLTIFANACRLARESL